MKLTLTPSKKNKPYSEEEIELLLSLAPTRQNVKVLAATFNRSRKAVKFLYRMAYSGGWLKSMKARGADNVIVKIARIKRRLGIVVGHKGN